MKSEHRHELKTNELAEWLANLPEWTKKNYKMLTLVAAVVVVAAGFLIWVVYNEKVVAVRKELRLTDLVSQLGQSRTQILKGHASGIDISYRLLELANNLQSLARGVKDRQVAALALIKRGEALCVELHYRLGGAREEERTAQIKDAQASYAAAFELSSGNPSLTAMAKLGLGICEEELGNFEEAERIYRDIESGSEFSGTAAVAQAMRRLETMGDYKGEVVFLAAPQLPVPPEMEFMQPRIELGEADMNIIEGMEGDVLEELTDLVDLPEVNLSTLPSE